MPFVSEKTASFVPPEPPLKEFVPPKEKSHAADPAKKSLLSIAKARDLTPLIGTELSGIQIHELTDAQKNELALLVSERGVVFFRDQEIAVEQEHELAKYYGIQDCDPNQQDPRHVTILGRDSHERAFFDFFAKERNTFHVDHSYELNSPGLTLLKMLKTPPAGGDTVFTSSYGLYATLSPAYKKFLSSLTATHSSRRGYIASLENGAAPRRHAVDTDHPLVATHPVTKLKYLNYNPTFVERFPDLFHAESDNLIKFLNHHVHTADDITVRWKWEPNSVAFWDNRAVLHKIVPGFYDKSLREGKRIAIYAPRAKYDEAGEDIIERYERLSLIPAVVPRPAFRGTNGDDNGLKETNGINAAKPIENVNGNVNAPKLVEATN